MDIQKAIQYEKTYQEARVKWEYPYHLIDKIQECGFETIKDYRTQKTKYLFESLEFLYIPTTQYECLNDVFKVIKEKTTCFLFADTEQTFIYHGTADYNKDYCTNNNILIYEIQTDGGTIISTEGDLSLGICCPIIPGVDAQYILNQLKNILQKHTHLLVEVKRNDILVNNKKILGSSTYPKEDMLMFVCHVSFKDNQELISNICVSNKIGKEVGYIDFLSREKFKQEVSEWLLTHSI